MKGESFGGGGVFVRGIFVGGVFVTGGVFARCGRRFKGVLKQNKTRFILPFIRQGSFSSS